MNVNKHVNVIIFRKNLENLVQKRAYGLSGIIS